MVSIGRSSLAVLNINVFPVYDYEQREEFIMNGYPEDIGKAVKTTARHWAQNAFYRDPATARQNRHYCLFTGTTLIAGELFFYFWNVP